MLMMLAQFVRHSSSQMLNACSTLHSASKGDFKYFLYFVSISATMAFCNRIIVGSSQNQCVFLYMLNTKDKAIKLKVVHVKYVPDVATRQGI